MTENAVFDDETLSVHPSASGRGIVDGSVSAPRNPGDYLPSMSAWLGGLTRARRLLADAEWTVTLDDLVVEWSEDTGYFLPGMDDPVLRAELSRFDF
ncbi:hypothetical protein [Stackebrandtia soli]|uniref:hypothetical protein n=1 Tax=Stackebrandtia soli TaxID=1892856 RepID=UPI0039E8302F